MQIINTRVSQPDPGTTDTFLVTLLLADSEEPGIEDESISINVLIETENDTPYLKEVQRGALDRALGIIQNEIQATKTVPRPAV